MTARELVQVFVDEGDLRANVIIADKRTGNRIKLEACDYSPRGREYIITVETEPGRSKTERKTCTTFKRRRRQT